MRLAVRLLSLVPLLALPASLLTGQAIPETQEASQTIGN